MAVKFECVPLLKSGAWHISGSTRRGEVFNPSTGKVIAQVPLCDAAETAAVVESAAQAWPAWCATPAVERARVMFAFRQLMVEHFEELAALITREHGKTLAESRAE
ncbi:MAG: aldehyde dehydrogenase family protein, partial [Planctomycetales bacterium]|nr:aldehyde dehydrogenase family protein [Planctomycetales bacterium]